MKGENQTADPGQVHFPPVEVIPAGELLVEVPPLVGHLVAGHPQKVVVPLPALPREAALRSPHQEHHPRHHQNTPARNFVLGSHEQV